MKKNYLEKKLKVFFPDKKILQTSSGTSAIISVLQVLKKKNKKKDEVILPSVCCPSVLFAVNFLGLKPIFVDMELKYFNMSYKDIKKKISKKSLAIIFVHCYGIIGDIEKIKSLTKKRKIFFIEDACLVFGGKYNKKFLGSFGDASILSFGYDKILSHKGGSLILKSPEIYKNCKIFLRENPIFQNTKIDEKIFNMKLKSLDTEIKQRAKNALYIYNNLKNKIFIKPKLRKNDIYWRYPMIYKGNRDSLIKKANKKKIILTKHYPTLNKFQNDSDLSVARLFEHNVINLFVKRQKNPNYLKNAIEFLNNV